MWSLCLKNEIKEVNILVIHVNLKNRTSLLLQELKAVTKPHIEIQTETIFLTQSSALKETSKS